MIIKSVPARILKELVVGHIPAFTLKDRKIAKLSSGFL
jgi:hypothetical protein